jgi:predicted dehydrogenase
MRVGIVGVGTIFASHLAGHREIGNEVVHLADVNEARARTAAGIRGIPRASRDWDALVRDDAVQVVDICTPPKFHVEIAIAALQGGKHVICEKPLAPTLAECDRILEQVSGVRCQVSGGREQGAGREGGDRSLLPERPEGCCAQNESVPISSPRLLVAHQYRYSEEQQRLKWLVAGGHLGEVCFARVVRYSPPPKALVQNGTWGNWELTGGGVLMTKVIHYLDLLCWMLGPAKRVQASMGTFLNPLESEDHVAATIEFASGAIGSIAVSGSAYRDVAQFELVGTRGTAGRPWFLHGSDQSRLTAELNRRFPIAKRSVADKVIERIKKKLGRPPAAKGPNQHALLFRDFFRAIESASGTKTAGDGQPDHTAQPATEEFPTAADGRRAVELCTAIYASAITGQAVHLPLDATHPFYTGVKREAYAQRAGSLELRP